MINHARTLLLNRAGASRPAPDFFLEEYVDPAYTPLAYPQYLLTLQNILLGRNADNAFANYRLWQYMRLLHSTEFAEYVYALDPRVTYLHERSVVADGARSSGVALNVSAQGIPLYFSGQVTVSAGVPRLQYSWSMEAIAGALIRTQSLQQPSLIQDTVVEVTSSLTNLIGLAGQRALHVRLGAELPLTVGARWMLEAFAAPDADLTAIPPQLDSTGDATLGPLFGTTEPYSVFQQLWEQHPFLQYRLSGLLLAFVYRAEEVRRRGG